MLGPYTVQYKTVLSYIHRLQTQVPSADLLQMCKLLGIILSYIRTLQSQSPLTHVLGLGNLQYKILLCCTHYVTQFPHDTIFPSTGKHYRACQCEVTGALS